MRLIKLFGLAASAAIAAMAFLGASSASAEFDTVLCSEDNGTLFCPSGKQVSAVHFEDPLAELLNDKTLTPIHCKALFLGNALGLAEAPNALVVHGHFSYTNCNNGCTASEQPGSDGAPGGLLLVLKTAAGLGEVTGHGFEVRVTCALLINCDFTEDGLVGHAVSATGSHNGLVSAHFQEVKHLPAGGQFLCPETAELHALFESATPLYLKS